MVRCLFLRGRRKGNAEDILTSFRLKTSELFRKINCLKASKIEESVKSYVQEIIDEYEIKATIVDAVVMGSRCRGLEHEGSDLDVVVELSSKEREDFLFNVFNEEPYYIGDVLVDINPITEQKTGTLEEYLPWVDEYLKKLKEKI